MTYDFPEMLTHSELVDLIALEGPDMASQLSQEDRDFLAWCEEEQQLIEQ